MRFLFVYWAFEDQGSGLVLQGYTEAAEKLGHEVSVYGRWTLGEANPKIPLKYSLDVRSADAVVFLFEWTTELKPGDQLDLARLVATVPRERRVIIDGDGKYNEIIRIADDYNHPDTAAARKWVEICDSLSDKICQPTLHPLRDDVRPFLFYAYDPAWARPLDFQAKDYGLLYVGHSKFRWRQLEAVLRAIEPVRERVGRIGLVGHGWDGLPWWADSMGLEETYFSDGEYLKELGVEVMPSIPFEQVIGWMSKAVVNPVLLRPTFRHLRFVTPRVFETPAASTIPLFLLDDDHVKQIFGDAAMELVLAGNEPEEKIVDIFDRPEHYAELVDVIRSHLASTHSHAARLRELVEIVEG